jgi:tryptophanyl-tRNA synthetase
MSESASSESRKVILTCAQPSGQLTLGNYLGAVKNWVALQDQYECYFGLADMHSITVKYLPADLRRQTMECLAIYLACGLDPQRCNIFLQSQVVGHTELAWVLGCITPLGDLHRMTQFKEKSAKPGASINAGLLYYPVLMAADILLYNADLVPVGNDQKQHLELCRNLAERFNSTYSPTFTVPDPYIPPVGARIMALQEPEKKMSKTDPLAANTIFLLDKPEVIRKKIGSAVTDSGSEVLMREDKPGVSNLLTIYSAVSGTPIADLEKQYAGKGYGDFKKDVAEAVVSCLQPVQDRYQQLMQDKDAMRQILADGAAAAQRRANRVLGKVMRKAGFLER